MIESMDNSFSPASDSVAIGLRLRTLLAQDLNDRRVAADELLNYVRLADSFPTKASHRAVYALLLLNKIHFRWSGIEGLEMNLKASYSLSAWDNIVQIINAEPHLIGHLFQALRDYNSGGLGHSEADGRLFGALFRQQVSSEKLNRLWGPQITGHRWGIHLGRAVTDAELTERANDVRWIREIFIDELSAGRVAPFTIRKFLQRNEDQPIHPDILRSLPKSDPIDLLQIEIAARDPSYGARVSEAFQADPEALTDSLLRKILNSGLTEGAENAIIKLILVPFISSRRVELCEKILSAIFNRHESGASYLPTEVQQYVLKELVMSIRAGPSSIQRFLRRDFLLRGVKLFDPGNGEGFSDPRVQAAILSIYGTPEYNQNPIAYNHLYTTLCSSVAVENYSAETRDFFRQRVMAGEEKRFGPALRRLSHFDRQLRNELILRRRREWYMFDAQIVDDFYHDVPELKDSLNSEFIKNGNLNENVWVRKHGTSESLFFNNYFAQNRIGLGARTADPLLLLAGPTPERHFMGAIPTVIFKTGDLLNNRGRRLPSNEEFDLLRLSPVHRASGHISNLPGLPSVTMLFSDDLRVGPESKKIYDIINEPYSEAGIDRLQAVRQGHQLRNQLLDDFVEKLSPEFILDPLPGLTESYSVLQEKLRNRANSRSQASQNRTHAQASALPQLTLTERASIEALVRAEVLSVIAQTNPLTEILFPAKSVAPFGQSPRTIPDGMTHEALGLTLPLGDILPPMPDHLETRRVVLSPDRLLSQPPYAQQYNRLVDQMTDDARQRKAQNLLQPPEVEIPLWRARQMNLLKANLRMSLGTVISQGHGDLVFTSEAITFPPGFEATGTFQGQAVHKLNISNLSHLDVGWNTVTNTPTLILAGQTVELSALQYLPHIPREMNPDAVSVYFMTEPDARGPHGELITKEIILRETLFRRSVPLLLEYYAQGARVLNQNLTSTDDLQFQLDHFRTQHEKTRSIRWIPQSLGNHAIAIEPLIWNTGGQSDMQEPRRAESEARRGNAPARNIASAYMDPTYPEAKAEVPKNKRTTVRSGSLSLDSETPIRRKTAPGQQPARIGGATNTPSHGTSEHVLHHVSYLGHIPTDQMPEHFLLGERDDFRNLTETRTVEISGPPGRSLLSTLMRGRSVSYPALVNVRSHVPWGGGKSAVEALLPRPENMALAHLEVTDLQGQRLTAGQDYDVLLHAPTGEYAVRLRPEAMANVPNFHMNVFYSPVSGEALAAAKVDPVPEYEISKLRPVIERARAAGFTAMAQNLNQLMETHEQQNRTTVSGQDLEATVKNSAYYSRRRESTFPGAPPNAEKNEFTEWAKFIAEDGIVCAQCDGTNEIHATFLASYHAENPAIRVQPRSEFSIDVGARELRLSDLHARVHEFHATESGPLRRIIYDVTPNRSDPRSEQAKSLMRLRTEMSRRALGVQSHVIDWWRRTKNVFARAAQFIRQRATRRKSLDGKTQGPLQLAGLDPVTALRNVDVSPVQPLPEPITPGEGMPGTGGELFSPESADANKNALGENEITANQNRETIVRELPQLRRVIQNLGGHGALDPRESLLLAERLARTYQRLIEGDLSLPEAVHQLNSISPELHLASDAPTSQVSEGFAAAARTVMERAATARRMESFFPHYRGAQGEHIQIVLANLLSPFGIEAGAVDANPKSTTVECIVESLRAVE